MKVFLQSAYSDFRMRARKDLVVTGFEDFFTQEEARALVGQKLIEPTTNIHGNVQEVDIVDMLAEAHNHRCYVVLIKWDCVNDLQPFNKRHFKRLHQSS